MAYRNESDFSLNFVCMGVLSACISVYMLCMPGAHRVQKKALNPLEPELQMSEGAGN